MTSFLPVSTPVAFSVSVLVKGAAVVGLAAILTWLLRTWAAAYRHAIWALGLSVALVLPVAEAIGPQWSFPELGPAEAQLAESQSADSPPEPMMQGTDSMGEEQTLRSEMQIEAESLPPASDTTSDSSETDGPPGPSTANGPSDFGSQGVVARGEALLESWAGAGPFRVLTWVWAAGALVLFGWVVAGLVRVGRRIRRAEPLTETAWADALRAAREEMGVDRPVRLYRSPSVSVPMTAGVLHPTILLPPSAAEWAEGRRRAVLLHEMAHVKRGDFLTNIAGQLACALHWINPLVWWAARQLRREREQACDDRVLATGVNAPDYSDHLVALARESLGRRRVRGALTMARPSNLKRRVQSILSRSGSRSAFSRGVAVALTGAFLIATVPVLAFGPLAGSHSVSPSEGNSEASVPQRLGDAADLDDDVHPLFQTRDISTAEQAADRLRSFHHQVDYTGGYLISEELLGRFPGSDRLWAWHALSLAQERRADSAAVIAERLRDQGTSSLWTSFGIAAGLQEVEGREQEIREAARQAFELAPNNPEVAWLKAEVLWETGKRKEAAREAYEAAHRIGDSPLLFAKAGYSYFHLARVNGGPDSLWQRAEESLRIAREMDSTSVPAFNNSGEYYRLTSKPEQAYQAYKQAARHSTSPNVHDSYWSAVRRLPGRSDSSANREIRKDIQRLKAIRPQGPNLLYEVAEEREELGDEERYTALRERLLGEYPRSPEAQWIQLNAIRAFRSTHRDSLYSTPSLKAEYKEKLRDFIDWPHHPNESLLGEAYRNLFMIVQDDSTVSVDTLLNVVKGMDKYEELNPHIVYAEAPLALAEREIALDYAAELARRGISAGKEQVRDRRTMYDTEREYQRRLAGAEARFRDALGWVYFRDGQFENAERQLQEAYSLVEPYGEHSRQNLYHLGRLHEERGDTEQAQTYYAAGLVREGHGENPNEEALKRIYRSRNGDLDGYEDYLADVRQEHQARTRKEILATRKDAPEPLPSFKMQTLEGDSLSSDELKDQITVINFWGKWCGPCVQEMPDVQTLYEKYRDNPDVRVLTIDHRDQVDELRSWIDEREFTFPVLIDRGYVQDTGITAYPTTWFVNPDGEIVFVKEGMTHNLVQEFTWRIEALLQTDSEA